MKLSIIIVNYNVSEYLRQCLISVNKAIGHIEAEIFVVDNASSDDSKYMLQNHFPQVRTLFNVDNVGFSRANNQAVDLAQGDYLLFLNPDTILPEDCLVKALEYLEGKPMAGGMGIRMIEGNGLYLPESKRGIPTPWVSFCKISGLWKLAPHSRRWSGYYMGHLDSEQNNEIEILAGAFILTPKHAYEAAGRLPEEYFMYGEDIDLSYSYLKKGFKNYYFADVPIVHYKGESTKKGSLNYVYVFYKAMAIFARKHFAGSQAKMLFLFIQLGIVLRAMLAALRRIVMVIGLPLFDMALIFAAFYMIKNYWESNHRFIAGGSYPSFYTWVVLPVYTLILVVSTYISGAYNKVQEVRNTVRGIAVGTLVLLVLYALLPENLRFSRAIVVLGASASMASMIVLRYFLHHAVGFKVFEKKQMHKNALWIHNKKDAIKVNEGLSMLYSKVYPLEINELTDLSEDYLVPYKKILQVNTLIFDAESFSYASIVLIFEKLKNLQFQYKIKNPNCDFLVGGDEVQWLNQQWNPEQIEGYKKAVHRKKRQFDVFFSIFILLPSMFFSLFLNYSRQLFKFSLHVMQNSSATWVGTTKQNEPYAWIYLVEEDSSIPVNHQSEIISEYYRNYSYKRDFLLLLNTIFKK